MHAGKANIIAFPGHFSLRDVEGYNEKRLADGWFRVATYRRVGSRLTIEQSLHLFYIIYATVGD